MDMNFVASNSYKKACIRRPWQISIGSQEFGFSCSLINSMEVASADELFFKGQLLPLSLDPRLHLVQTLSSEGVSSSRLPSRSSYVSQDKKANEFSSCFMGCPEAGCASCHESTSMVISSHSGRRLSLCCIDEETVKAPWHSYWSRDEEISFKSCETEGDVGLAFIGDLVMELQSSSFRPQDSGFWESGADKEYRISSRDSNGSSQECNGSKNGQNEEGKSKGTTTSRLKSKSVLCKAADEDVITHASTKLSKGSISSKDKAGQDDEYEKEEMKKKQQRSAAIKGKWHDYIARRLNPFYELKRGMMSQVGIDECERRAHKAVESGNKYAASASSTITAAPKHKSTTLGTRKTNTSKGTGNSILPTNLYTSMSTMHELQSALQNAIAHCKESMKED